jgi:hypothetical protein
MVGGIVFFEQCFAFFHTHFLLFHWNSNGFFDSGRGVALMGYQASDAWIPLVIRKYEPSWARVSPSAVSPGGPRRDACLDPTAALAYPRTNRIAFTQNAFSSVEFLLLPLGMEICPFFRFCVEPDHRGG